jgi:hypothetical protein
MFPVGDSLAGVAFFSVLAAAGTAILPNPAGAFSTGAPKS